MKERIISVLLIFVMCLCVGCQSTELKFDSQAVSAEPTAALPASPQPTSVAAPEIIDTVSMDEGKPEQAADEIPPA